MYFLRCKTLGLTFDDLDNLDIGLVYDMLIEQGNDLEKYPEKATQDDIDRFFG